MAHFAQIVGGEVTQVINISNDVCGAIYPESEPIGQAFIASLNLGGEWKQCSYSGSFRGRYCGVGFTYNDQADVFIEPQPFPSWRLDHLYNWQAPTTKPTSGLWNWDETNLAWVQIIN